MHRLMIATVWMLAACREPRCDVACDTNDTDTDARADTDIATSSDTDAVADTDACPSGQVLDCDQECAVQTRIGQGYCDDGTVHPWGSSNFACDAFAWDGGDCPDPNDTDDTDGPCPRGQILDCDDECAVQTRIGQGYCDDGTVHPWGSSNFACDEFGWDGGDCAAPSDTDDSDMPDTGDSDQFDTDTDTAGDTDDTGDTDAPCPHGQILDCDVECAVQTRIGQGYCDDGTVHPWGSANFACDAFAWDDGDCPNPNDTDDTGGPCPIGQILDCDAECAVQRRIGQGYCDDGTVHPWGSANFACAAFAWDGGDCPTPPDTGDSDVSDTDTTIP